MNIFSYCGRSIVVMHRPSKPARWVRSPSPAFGITALAEGFIILILSKFVNTRCVCLFYEVFGLDSAAKTYELWRNLFFRRVKFTGDCENARNWGKFFLDLRGHFFYVSTFELGD